MIDLYDDHCPNEASKFSGVERVDDIGFNIYAFHVRDRTTIKFDCDVRIYGQDEALPPECTTIVRRRRSNAVTKKVKGNSFENSYENIRVVITLIKFLILIKNVAENDLNYCFR